MIQASPVTYSGLTTRPARLEKSWTGKAIWRPVTGVAITLIVIAYLLGGLDGFIGGDQSSEARAGGNSLAIIGFENKTGDESLEWMETGLPEILLTDLSQGLGLRIISQQRILDCFETDRKTTHKVTEYAKAAQRLGAGKILSGSFYKMGDKLRIDARLEDISTGTVVLAEKVVGDDPFELVNRLTARIAASLELEGIAQASTKPLSSPEAFKEYHLGMELFWANEYDSAITRLEDAIEIDSTFGLPYMKIGMAHIFSGRQADGVAFMRLAEKHRESLPPAERNLLDIYIDIWVNVHYDRAFDGLERLVRDYPDDAEIRTIYAIFLNAFKQDTTATFAQFDTILTKYPSYPFAITQYASILRQYGLFDRVETMIVRLNTVLPNSISANAQLSAFRQRQGRFAEALELAEKLHEQVPSDKIPLYRLISINFHLGDPTNAQQWAEKLRQLEPDDRYNLFNYYSFLRNADVMEGHFQQAKVNLVKQYEQALAVSDSSMIFRALNSLSDYYRRFEALDSMVIWETEAYRYAKDYNRISYVLRMIAYDRSTEARIRPLFDSIRTDFKEKMPREIWGIADAHEIMFDAILSNDTAKQIEASRQIVEVANEYHGDDAFELGRLQILFGEYAEGKELIEQFVQGQYRTNNAYRFLTCQWLVGRAYEGLGETDKAVEKYNEFLKF